MTIEIIVLGAAGDGRVVADAVRQAQNCGDPVELVGFLDDGRTTAAIDDIPVLGGIRDWRLCDSSIGFIAALHKIKKMHARSQLIDGLEIPETPMGDFCASECTLPKKMLVWAKGSSLEKRRFATWYPRGPTR